MDMKKTLENYFNAGYPGIAIRTHEEQRAMADIIEAARSIKRNVVTWAATEGLRFVMLNGEVIAQPKGIPQTEDLLAACAHRNPETIYILRDIASWPFERDPILPRALRDMLQYAPTVASCVVILGPEYKPHTTVEKLVVVTDYELPTEGDLTKIAKEISTNAGKEFNGNAAEIVRALSGLSTTEAENACALSLVEEGILDPAIIYREKIAGVKKSGLLEIAEPDPRGLDAVGGLDAMKTWIVKRKRAFTPEAVAYGLPAPKGVLIVGVPGTGKSLSAKAIGTALGVPTLRLDIGALFNSLVGESESRTRSALNLAEALAPCVVWVDEVDKGLAGASGSGAGDSGVTKRVFGTIITWMQERKRPVFLVATANDVTNLPPEFLRRWDVIFAVDLPNDEERAAIFQIHLLKRGRERLANMFAPPNQNASLAVAATAEFTGSEIEKVIEAAMFDAFDDGSREFTLKDIIIAARKTTPLAQTAKEKIDAIRDWAKTRATWASSKVADDKLKARVVKAR